LGNGEFFFNVTWEVSVVGVVDLLGVLENEWLVESVEFISGLGNVVLDTISISISDSVGSCLP